MTMTKADLPPMEVPVLYEDNHILVVVKPVNMPSQQDESNDPDLLSVLKEDLKVRYQKPGNVYLGLVHRLDRPVGGVMVFAKTSKAASRLADAVRTRKLDKTYLAVVHGTPKPTAGRLVHYLLKDSSTNTVSSVPKAKAGAKEAILDYKVIGPSELLSLVEIRLLTGRSHQIRVQMSTEGHPLYGDQRYGHGRNRPGQQIALWSSSLSFEHPVKREWMTFSCSPPTVYPWTEWREELELK